jgi:5-methylcytosine-specific restriction endonuclease McrA
MNELLKKEIFRRYSKHGFNFLTWEELKQKTGLDESKELLCYYCLTPLQAHEPYPHWNVVSLDHKLPKYRKGQNNIENTCLCCARCNVVKGTMREATYKLFLELLTPTLEIREQIFSEIYWGRFADKLRREEKSKKELWELV